MITRTLLGWTTAIGILGTAATLQGEPRPVELTGWFADENCAAARVKAGQIGPTGRECAQRQIAKGVAVVFIDEEGKRLLRVANPEAAAGQESHYVRVSGTLDGETLRVASLEVMQEYAPSCGRLRKPRPPTR
jgi:hypothetical protein